MMMDLARYYSNNQPDVSVAFIAFGAEETGLDGSHYFSQNMPFAKDKVLFSLNLDMVGTGSAGINVVNGRILHEYFNTLIAINKEKDYLKNAFKAGAHDYIEKPINKIEFLARIKAALRLREEMKKRKGREKELLKTSKKLKKANKKLEKMASMDGLTGLANRRLFDEILKKELLRAKRNNSTISLIMADIDNFKDYNDNYGHQAGDQCLKKIAKTIEETTNRPADLAARYGGEEFSIILPDTNKEGAIKIAEKIRENIISLEIEHAKSDVAEYVTLSLGVNSSKINSEIDDKRIEEFIEKADKALYKAKENGRNMVVSN